MLSKSCFPGKWKHKRWKTSKLYSTKDQTQQMQNTHIVSANIAITQRAKVGQLDIARNLFDQMSTRTVVSWNTMISGYSNVCAQLKSLIDGKQIHCLVLKCGYEKFEFVGSSLLYFYAKCLEIEEAKRVFLELRDDSELLWTLMLVGYVQCNLMSEALDVFMNMKRRGVVAWTKLISGYAKSEDGCEKALELFSWMRESGEAMPNEYTFHTAIRACGRLGVLREGRVVHGTLIKYGFEFDHSIGCALIEFYCVCEAANDAKRVYDRIVNPCLSSSNSLINGLILMGRIDEAELIFNRLTEANSVSYNLMIKGYAAMGRVLDSERLFGKMPHRTIISTNTMISVYSRNDEIKKAVELFEETKGERNPVTWNSMMSGYIQNDLHEEALQLYVTLCKLGIDRTRSTFSVLFHACSCLGSLQQGKLLHAHLVKTPFDSNVYVGTSLIDMYSKCGSLTEARASFSSISAPNVVVAHNGW
ncbi:hypothetical protein Patl1_20315 [Pistacia atlantica]|uniref:Uncharacterized protein n=1 Tax=Pistacia atlantica TaxID=434234 RepID=A0ACC1BNP6_9ROSI|nr:hypothetical protein Patl1_20315 [Pistacia atlantica]